ncbi:MAG: transcriptional regulator GcvA [Xanthobacteraceae bacterium]|nr:transcriptional regulator GcvA [Xanthobacteraceae bacterium]
MSKILPSLNALRAFEAAARLKSLTRAAEEMNVTQAAVSRQVRTLEEYLEVALFRRGHRTIELTSEGSNLFKSITSAFSEIEHAVLLASRRGRRSRLSVRTYTTFAQRWLIPKLARFHTRYPAIEVFLSASNAQIDFERDHIDAAIRYGREDEFQDYEREFVAPYQITPICSPSMIENVAAFDEDFLRRATLLHSMARPRNWNSWLQATGMSGIDPTKGLKFESSAMAYDAAMQGIGIAMGVLCMVADDLRANRLVTPFPQVHHEENFYLVYRLSKHLSPVLMQFRDWIREEVEADSKGA